MLDIPVKFFPKDILSGKADKVGDIFTALFFGAETYFTVVERHRDVIMATMN